MATTNTSRFGGMETPESLLGNLLHMLDVQLFREVPVPFLGEVPLVKLIMLVCTFIFINIIGRLAKNIQHKRGKIKHEENVAREESNNSAPTQKVADPKMTISQLYIYPIKSLRGCSLPSATLTKEGFSHDRKFMLLRIHDQDSKWGPHQNMHVTHFPQMALFHTSIQGPNLYVTYHDPGSSQAPDSERPTLKIELTPSTFSHLQELTVNMHGSATTAYSMGPHHNDWFSQHFGFPVILAHTGDNRRLVLGNLPQSPQLPTPATKLLQYLPFTGSSRPAAPEPENIAFNDCAPYLIITTTSCNNIAQRLPPTTPLDITKFRANIIISGSPSAFTEDYWGDLEFSPSPSSSSSNPESSRPPKIHLTANCGRCISLNVDHATGTTVPQNEGILKLLMRDRRVDPGVKYSPIFGRYGFIRRSDSGTVLKVGDSVSVTRTNEQRTRFYWPGIST
ncbi:hypothetical protein EYC80_002003 [Monilinia laxa]|uniref:MOSC domain-containing protein n=1 Tax=Monilinia laxa TaxID=61186 RepID=A0A5N6K6X5_MONLA|nr:hypothetical protein EYC80_002003 [Monilinia laxa]